MTTGGNHDDGTEQASESPSVETVDARNSKGFVARNVGVQFGNELIVDDASFFGYKGEVLGIIGPNGAGKTTVLKVLAGLLNPSAGYVTIGDTALDDIAASSRPKRIAYVPQSAGTHPFTVLETVLMGRYPHLRRFQIESKDDTAIALAALDRMDVAQFKDRRISTLSGGERQRVLLARALAQKSDVLFVDEPLTSLDIKHQLLSLQVLRDEARERDVTVCAVLHDLNMAARFCDRLVLMSKGRVVAVDAPVEVITEEHIHEVFGVRATVRFDALTSSPRVELIGAS